MKFNYTPKNTLIMNAKINAQIKEVQSYFIQKIISGDFRVTECDDNDIGILIGNQYYFGIWIGHEPNDISMFQGVEPETFMQLNFSPAEKKEIFKILKVHQDLYFATIGREKKLKEYYKLQNELGFSSKRKA